MYKPASAQGLRCSGSTSGHWLWQPQWLAEAADEGATLVPVDEHHPATASPTSLIAAKRAVVIIGRPLMRANSMLYTVQQDSNRTAYRLGYSDMVQGETDTR
jgi:hypothetical protein